MTDGWKKNKEDLIKTHKFCNRKRLAHDRGEGTLKRNEKYATSTKKRGRYLQCKKKVVTPNFETTNRTGRHRENESLKKRKEKEFKFKSGI